MMVIMVRAACRCAIVKQHGRSIRVCINEKSKGSGRKTSNGGENSEHSKVMSLGSELWNFDSLERKKCPQQLSKVIYLEVSQRTDNSCQNGEENASDVIFE